MRSECKEARLFSTMRRRVPSKQYDYVIIRQVGRSGLGITTRDRTKSFTVVG